MERTQKVPLWRLLLLSAAGAAVELGYAVEESYALPIIRGVGVPLSWTTVALGLSPILGMVLQTFLGAVSDQCKCSWGKRKPFILGFCIAAMVGCSASYMSYFSDTKLDGVVVMLLVIGLTLVFDFSIGQLQLPTRAFLLDVIPVSQSHTGNFVFTLAMTVYATLGFAFGAVDWAEAFGEGLEIEHQAQVVFGFAALVIFISMMMTLFSIKENTGKNRASMIRLECSYSMTMSADFEVMDNADDDVNKNSLVSSSPEKQPLIALKQTNRDKTTDSDDNQYSMPSDSTHMVNSIVLDSDNDKLEVVRMHGSSSEKLKETMNKPLSCCDSGIMKLFVECFHDVFSFIYNMSYHMWIVWFMTLCGFIGEFTYVFGFTTFVGTEIYGGNSQADHDSKEYELYAKGVRMGSLGLALSTIVGGILALTLGYITRWINLKTVLLFSLAAFVVCTSLMIAVKEVSVILILGLSYGPFLVMLFTVPFALIPIYEKKELLFRKDWENAPDVIQGKACSVINIAVFLGQIGAFLLAGPIVESMNNDDYFMLISCVAVTISFLTAIFIKSPSS